MKVLTLTQPWASLVMLGEKTIETRSWSTRHRGALAIHAAKGYPRRARDLAARPPFCTHLAWHGLLGGDLPTGRILCTCNLVDVVRVGANWMGRLGRRPTDAELAFGNFSEGRYAWVLEDVVILPEPIEARGALGLWEYDLPQSERDAA